MAWGSGRGYAIQFANIVNEGYGPLITATLGWTDSSHMGGGSGLSVSFSSVGLTIAGAGNDGSLLCGSIYAGDPYDNFSDPVGVLPVGCGLTNDWTLWGPEGASSAAQLTEQRDQILGVTDGGRRIEAFATESDAGALVFVGDGGGLVWFPSGQDQTFAGDNGSDAGWCGSSASGPVSPSPCFE